MEKQERRPESRKESHSSKKKLNPKVVESGKKMKEDIDKLVDEIDDVLGKNGRTNMVKRGE
ncbi:MAG: ubiquitin-like protein Pup [Nitrospiraceae bacterium]